MTSKCFDLDFKAGDRVRLVWKDYLDHKVGDEFEILTSKSFKGRSSVDKTGYAKDAPLVLVRSLAIGGEAYMSIVRFEKVEVPTFKIGDLVRFTDKCLKIWWFGPKTAFKEGVVVQHNRYGYRYAVKCRGSANPAFVDDEHIELVKETYEAPKSPLDDRGTFVIMLFEGGRYLPAPAPRTYSTRSQAKAVALKMAEKHGKPSHVFQMVGGAAAEVETIRKVTASFVDA